MKGARIVIESLVKEGVEVMFGYPGGMVIPIFHEIFDSPIKFILSRHEQGAIHAADGYARVSGKPGVVIATSGPGATNIVTGLANAYLDSVPLVAITGQVSTAMIGNDAFQEADVTGITRPVTKHNYLVTDIRDLARTIKEAFYIASTGRPGPVLIDIPVNISNSECEFEYPETVEIRGYKPNYKGHPVQIKKACDMIAKAKRPVIYAGGGIIISGASEELRALVRKTGIPCTTTLLGLGAFPSDDPLSLGMLGMHGTYYANHAVNQSDLLIAIGARFDDRVTGKVSEFIPHAKVIHIDIDPASVSKSIEVDIPIVGDCRMVLNDMLEIIKAPEISEWVSKIGKMKEEHPLTYEDNSEYLKPQYVIQKISEKTEGKAIICTEVGQHQMWAAQFSEHRFPRHFVSSGGLGTMGFGLPASIGAQIARPDHTVVDISGDGSVQMNIQELIVAVEHKLPIIIAILDNGYLGMVRQWQQMFWQKRYSHTDIRCAPDFVKLADAYGANGIRVKTKEELDAALKAAIETRDRPTVLDIIVEPEENVYPMVPAGKSVKEIITRELA
jgi:acetolactate synthase-1/2/3 large subunit